MKRLLLLILFLITSLECFASILQAKIDKRIELTSIVFRLAGAKEYVTDRAPNYLLNVDNFFSGYANHELIEYIRQIREPQGLGYDIVANTSFLFDIKDGHIVRLSNNKVKSWVMSEWNEESAERYFKLLDAFYSDTNFELFWEQQHGIRCAALENAQIVLDSLGINTGWFGSFFGEKINNVEVFVAMANGNNNYTSTNFTENDCKSKIIIGCSSELNGVPELGGDILGVLTHEICHTMGNDLILSYLNQFISFDSVYKHICDVTKQYGYGDSAPRIAIIESLIELFCVEYLLLIDKREALYYIADMEDRGYPWMSDIVRFMCNFNSNRSVYPSIKEFMPQIIAYYNELPNRIDAIVLNNAAKKPYVESTYPANNSVVPADIKEIRVTFSQPLIDAYGQRRIDGIDPIPLGDSYRSEDHRTIIVPVSKPLELNKTYGIELEGVMFVSEKTFHRMSNNYKLIFRTK